MADEIYGKGIKVTSGFDLGAKSPLDTRTVVNTIEERDNHVINNRVYEGMIVYVIETQRNYQYVDSKWVDFAKNTEENTGGGGNANIHIGDNEPNDETHLWIDTNTPYTFDVSNYDDRIRLKYVEMLEMTIEKTRNMKANIEKISNNIDSISAGKMDSIVGFKSRLGQIENKTNTLTARMEDLINFIINGNELTNLKDTAKSLRKESKILLKDIYQLNTDVLYILDEEIKPDSGGIIVPPSGDDNTGDITSSGVLLTEDGKELLTENGLSLLVDGIVSDVILANSILTELGLAILTEDSKQILKD